MCVARRRIKGVRRPLSLGERHPRRMRPITGPDAAHILNCSCRPGTCRYADACRTHLKAHAWELSPIGRFCNYHPRLLAAADFIIRDRHALIIHVRSNEVIFTYEKKARTLVTEIEGNRGEKGVAKRMRRRSEDRDDEGERSRHCYYTQFTLGIKH